MVVTGARQVGKTTLARELYENSFRYLNLDSPGERARLALVPADGWHQTVGPAILDEVQKAPLLLDNLKWAYDEGKLDFSVILGSSRITLLEQVSAIISQMLIHLWTLGIRITPSFLRTSGGTEVDLLLEGQHGILAIEIKNRPKVTAKDAASIERSRKLIGDAYQAGIVVYRGSEIGQISRSVFAVPDWVLFGR